MIVNGKFLLDMAPIKNMKQEKIRKNGVSYGLSEAGYDIRIAQDIIFYGPNGNTIRSQNDDGTRTEKVIVGNFVLASAMEEFQMPNDLVGIVHDKSTWARQGLSVFNTVIEPGWNGYLTIELAHHNNQPLHIPAGSGIAQVIFHSTTNAAEYSGKYANQPNRPVGPIESV